MLCAVHSLRFALSKGGSVGSGSLSNPDLTTPSRSVKKCREFGFPRGGQLGLGCSLTQTLQHPAGLQKSVLSLTYQVGGQVGLGQSGLDCDSDPTDPPLETRIGSEATLSTQSDSDCSR